MRNLHAYLQMGNRPKKNLITKVTYIKSRDLLKEKKKGCIVHRDLKFCRNMTHLLKIYWWWISGEYIFVPVFKQQRFYMKI